MITTDIEKKNEIISKAYDNAQGMVSLADAKANISLTIQSILIGIGLGVSFLVTDTNEKLINLLPTNPAFVIFYLILIIIYVISSLFGIIMTIFVYKPRVAQEKTERERKGIFYYGHVKKYKSSMEYLKKIQSISEDDLLEEYSKQIYQISLIADRKMKFVNISILFLLINIIFTVVFLILGGFVNIYV